MKIVVSILSLVALVGCSGLRSATNPNIAVDFTKGVSDICPIHDMRMQKIAANVLLRFPHVSRLAAFAEYDEAQKSLFPFGETIYSTTDSNFMKRADFEGGVQVQLYLCEKCRAVGDGWRDEWRYGKKKG